METGKVINERANPTRCQRFALNFLNVLIERFAGDDYAERLERIAAASELSPKDYAYARAWMWAGSAHILKMWTAKIHKAQAAKAAEKRQKFWEGTKKTESAHASTAKLVEQLSKNAVARAKAKAVVKAAAISGAAAASSSKAKSTASS